MAAPTSPPAIARARPLRRLETFGGMLARLRAAHDPGLERLILDLEERIRLIVRELQELDRDRAVRRL